MKRYLCRILLLLSINTIPGAIFGQSNDYYVTDSTLHSDVSLVNGGRVFNSKFCEIVKSENTIKYTPYEVSEYGFKSGLTYRSFMITLGDEKSRFFLERLVTGKQNLYYLKLKGRVEKFYLIGNDSSDLIEIPVRYEDYSVLFGNLIKDCQQSVNNIPLVRIRKSYLKKFVNDYNNCAQRTFPGVQYGFTIGTIATQLSAVEKGSVYSIPDYKTHVSISIGAFADIPLYASSFSFRPEMYFKNIGMSKPFDHENTGMDLVNNYSSISFPLFIKYRLNNKKVNPFFQLGPIYSMTIRNNGRLYEYKTVNNNTYINIINSPILQTHMGGFSIGGGLIFKNSIFCDIGYSKFYNLSNENKLLNFCEYRFTIGHLFQLK